MLFVLKLSEKKESTTKYVILDTGRQ